MKKEHNIEQPQNPKLKINTAILTFCMDSVLDFGKHKGKKIKQLFDEKEENYVMWLFENIDGNWSFEVEAELERRQVESNQVYRDFTLVFD